MQQANQQQQNHHKPPNNKEQKLLLFSYFPWIILMCKDMISYFHCSSNSIKNFTK